MTDDKTDKIPRALMFQIIIIGISAMGLASFWFFEGGYFNTYITHVLGLKYIYVGNIPGDQKENTYCPKCGELSIRRLGYNVERMDNNGRCPSCDCDLDIIE